MINSFSAKRALTPPDVARALVKPYPQGNLLNVPSLARSTSSLPSGAKRGECRSASLNQKPKVNIEKENLKVEVEKAAQNEWGKLRPDTPRRLKKREDRRESTYEDGGHHFKWCCGIFFKL